MSAAIDLNPRAAATAALAARSKKDVLLRRLDELGALDQHALLAGIVPYGDDPAHGAGMIGKGDDGRREVAMTGTLAAARNAVANASRGPVSDEQILAILATGDGPGHLVRALFQDCTFETLDRLGAEHGIARSVIRQAYAHARQLHAAINTDLEG